MKRKIIHIDESLCNGCGLCIPSCPEQAIQLVDTPDGQKARLVKEIFCDGLGACLGNCPTGALTIEEREAEAYDDEATIARIKQVTPEMLETHIQHLQEHADEMQQSSAPQPTQFGCPGARMAQWNEERTDQNEQSVKSAQSVVSKSEVPQSELRQWPVQLNLVHPGAPYFEEADLVIAADCVPVAYANFHQEFLKGKAIVIGCPKFDDAQAYLDKLTQIIRLGKPKSITIVNMEVPCCFGLVRIVQLAIEQSGQDVPFKTVTINIKGDKLT
jgi:NAD-dependent dihydropyrimidine dehydrogenase PreA subunit